MLRWAAAAAARRPRRRLLRCLSSPPAPAAHPGVDPASVVAFIAAQWADAPCERLECVHVGGDRARLRCAVPASDVRPGGFVSGPAQFALADLGMWVAVWGARGLHEMALTSEMSIRFLRPAVGTALHADVRVESAGTRSLVMTARVWTDAETRPTAVAQGTYVMPTHTRHNRHDTSS